jgi:hypothetical protein
MNQDMERFLNLRHLPASVTAEQAAGYFGLSAHEIPILVAKGLLKPLGHPPPNGQKFFLTATLEELRRDEKWFGKARDAIVDYWRFKNSRKGQNSSDGPEPEAAVA